MPEGYRFWGDIICQGGRKHTAPIQDQSCNSDRVDRKLPKSEKANNCLSTNKEFWVATCWSQLLIAGAECSAAVTHASAHIGNVMKQTTIDAFFNKVTFIMVLTLWVFNWFRLLAHG